MNGCFVHVEDQYLINCRDDGELRAHRQLKLLEAITVMTIKKPWAHGLLHGEIFAPIRQR